MDLSFVTRKFQRSMAGLSLLAILASFAGFTGTAFANTFPDVSSSYFAYDQIDSLSTDGIMTGYDNGNFGPSDTLTREQAAKILVEAFVGSVDSSYDAGFSDVADGMWYTDYVNTAALYGIASGNPDGTFGVGDNINRADFAKMVVSAAGLDSDGTMGSDMFNDVTSGAYYDSYVGTAYVYSVVDGTSSTSYSPANSVTRGQAAKMTYNAMNPVYRGDTTGGNTSNADATVTVAVSNDTPSADTLPSNATSVELASFDFTAEGNDTVLDGVTVHQYGISSVPSGALVYLYNGAERLTSGTTVNSTTHESDFRNLNLDLNEGDTTTLTVRMDMGSWSATGEVGFEIASASKVDVGDSSVDGDFPAQGDKFSVSTTSVGSVTIDKNGNVDNAQVGEDDAYVGKFKLTASSTEGGYVQELGMYIAGTVSTADVENFRLYVTGDDAEPIAQVDNVDSLDVVRFVVGEGEGVMTGMSDGYQIEKGNSKSFYVLADFNTGRTGDTVQMYVDQSTDIVMTGDLYGYGESVVRTAYDGATTACTSSAGACTFQTLQGGDITVSSNGPSAADIAINGKDVALLNFVVTSVTDVTFDNFPVALTASESSDTTEGLLNGTAANFTDIKIVDSDSGSQLYSSVDATSLITTEATTGSAVAEGGTDGAIGYYVWTDDWQVDAGSEYNLSVETDIANTSTLDAMTVVASLPFTGTFPALKDTNNKTLTNSSVLVPNSSITGKTMTVRSPSLTLTLASSPAAGSNVYVKGQSGVQFTGIVFACGQSSDCKITDLTLQGYLDDNGNASAFSTTTGADHTSSLSSYVGSVSLVDSDGNTLAASKAVNTSTSQVQYTNMNWTIDAGDTVIAYVMGSISNDAYANSDAENIAFGISSASNVTVENQDGNGFSATGTINTTPTTYVTTSNGGTLTFTVGGSTPKEDIIVAGTSSVEMSEFTLTATREAFVVHKLSLNNRQSSVANANIGNYDNNTSKVTVSYTNSSGSTETKDAYLVNGTAQFTGLDLYVGRDKTVTLKTYATLNPISTSGSSATAGEFVDLALAFDTFEAVAGSSGATYKADAFDATSALMSKGTIAYTDPANGIELASAQNLGSTTVVLGSTTTVLVDNAGAAPSNRLPVGTEICMDDGDNGACSGEDLYVVTSWDVCTASGSPVSACSTDADADATYTDQVAVGLRLSDDAGDRNYADASDLMYALPGTGFFSDTKQSVVYESKPTLALASTSPSGSRSVSSSDDAFVFTVSANSNEKVQLRAAQINDASTTGTGFQLSSLAGAWTAATADTVTAPGTGGIGNSAYIRDTEAGNNAAGSIFTFTTAGQDLSVYNGISFWTRMSEVANTTTLTIDGSGVDQTCVTPTLTAATWSFVDCPFTGMTAANLQGVSLLSFLISDGSGVAAATYDIDRVALYYEKITVDGSANAIFDTSTSGTADNLVATLKQGGSTVATGYFYSSTQGADASSTSVTFYPQAGTDSNIDIDAGTTKTFTLNTNTQSLLKETSSVDDPVSFSITYGTSTDGTVSTTGEFWWYDTNATVKWVGKTDNTSLVSNTVNY